MPESINAVGEIMIGFGVFSTIVIGSYYGVWKLYFKKVRLSQTEFVKAVTLVGISAFVTGLCITILSIINLLQYEDQDWLPVIVSIVGCLGIYPMVMTGMFILHVKWKGFVERNRR